VAFASDLLDLLFSLEFSTAQLFGLFFLLGSFTVAALSDLKHLAAQREFVEVWFFFAGMMLVLDFVQEGLAVTMYFGVKWLLIAALAVMSHRRFGPIFHLATGDVAALVAVAGLLAPGWVVLYWATLKLVNLPLAPLLARGKDVYPFMPVVTAATLVVVAIAGWMGGIFS